MRSHEKQWMEKNNNTVNNIEAQPTERSNDAQQPLVSMRLPGDILFLLRPSTIKAVACSWWGEGMLGEEGAGGSLRAGL